MYSGVILISLSIFSSAIAQPSFERLLFSASSDFSNSTDKNSLPLPDGLIITGEQLLDKPFVLSLDSNGLPQWSEFLARKTGYCSIRALAHTPQGSIIGCGLADIPWVFSLSRDGQLQWSYIYNLGSDAVAEGVSTTSDGGIIISGGLRGTHAADQNSTYGFILKIDSNGTPLWCYRAIQGYSTQTASYTSISEAPDHSLFLSGMLQFGDGSILGPTALTLLHLDAEGKILERSNYVSDGQRLQAEDIILTSSGKIMISASAGHPLSERTVLLIRLSDLLHPVWSRVYNFFSLGIPGGLCESSNGNFICMSIALDSSSQLFSVDTTGFLQSVARLQYGSSMSGSFGRYLGYNDRFYSAQYIFTDSGSQYLVNTFTGSLNGCGFSQFLSSNRPFEIHDTTVDISYNGIDVTKAPLAINQTPLLFTATELCNSEVNPTVSTEEIAPLSIFPNPTVANSSLNIIIPLNLSQAYTIILRDLIGREVYRTRREIVNTGEQIQLPTAGLASGVYTVELIDASSFANVWRGKVVIE